MPLKAHFTKDGVVGHRALMALIVIKEGRDIWRHNGFPTDVPPRGLQRLAVTTRRPRPAAAGTGSTPRHRRSAPAPHGLSRSPQVLKIVLHLLYNWY